MAAAGERAGVLGRVELARAAAAARGDVELASALGNLVVEVDAFEECAERYAGLGRLAAGVVHEMNNPLTVITMNVEMMLDEARSGGALAPEAEKLQAVADAALRIQRFMRDLMSYARPGSDRREPVKLSELVEKAERLCKPALKEANAKLVNSFGTEQPVLGHRASLEQVVVNLVTNAAEAIGDGGSIHVSVSGEGAEVVLEVRDSGRGMAPEIAARCMEPFFTTLPGGRGTGLGLPIAAGIVSRHGGQIDFRTEPGKGTTFTVRLPAAP